MRTIDEARATPSGGVRYLIGHGEECAIEVIEDAGGTRSYWWVGLEVEPPEKYRRECDRLIDES